MQGQRRDLEGFIVTSASVCRVREAASSPTISSKVNGSRQEEQEPPSDRVRLPRALVVAPAPSISSISFGPPLLLRPPPSFRSPTILPHTRNYQAVPPAVFLPVSIPPRRKNFPVSFVIRLSRLTDLPSHAIRFEADVSLETPPSPLFHHGSSNRIVRDHDVHPAGISCPALEGQLASNLRKARRRDVLLQEGRVHGC